MRTLKKITNLVVANLIAFTPSLSFADSAESKLTPTEIEKLIAPLISSHARPSVEQVLSILTPTILKKPEVQTYLSSQLTRYGTPARGSVDAVELQNVKNLLAPHIAQLEMAFPGGTYAYLGRDSALIADLVKAFYLSVGQPGRAVRLNASTEAFSVYEDPNGKTDPYSAVSEEVLTDFMKTTGLDPSTDKPFIMIDTTSLSSQSQSTKLARAAVNLLLKNGYSADQVVRKFNVGDFSDRGCDISTKENLKLSLDSQAANIKGTGFIRYQLKTPVSTTLTYGLEWHQPFRAFKRNSDGSVIGLPGAENDSYYKLKVLAQLAVGLNSVLDPQFLTEVQSVAKSKFGIVFEIDPKKRAELEKQLSEEQRQLRKAMANKAALEQALERKEARALELVTQSKAKDARETALVSLKKLSKLPELKGEKEYTKWQNGVFKAKLTENALKLVSWYEERKSAYPDVESDLLRAAVALRESKQIGERDLRRIVAYSLNKPEVSLELQKTFIDLISKSSSMESQFFSHDRIEEYMKEVAYGEQIKKNYSKISRLLRHGVVRTCVSIFSRAG